MPTVSVFNNKSEQIGEIELRDEIFNVTVKPHILHEVVNLQLAKRRAGTASTKGRKEVRGGGRKPYRQKGTGRARAGTRSSPLWRGGGVTFGPKPRDYTYKVNKKIRKQALKMALTSKFTHDQMVVLDSFDLLEIKTSDFAGVLQCFGMANVLVVTAERDDVLERSARNVPHTKILRSDGLNVYDILKYRHLVVIKDALPKIEASLLG